MAGHGSVALPLPWDAHDPSGRSHRSAQVPTGLQPGQRPLRAAAAAHRRRTGGGDQLSITADLATGSRALLTSVAAQKVYGTVGRSRQAPAGLWAEQQLRFQLAVGADLEWLPQELVLYRDGLFEQRVAVELAAGASFLTAEVVRLGRTAAGERLGKGAGAPPWRSAATARAPPLGTGGPAGAGW